MGSIFLTVVKFSLYLVDFNIFIILSVTVCVLPSTLDLILSLIHILQSVAALKGGGGGGGIFSSTQAFYFSMLHYRSLNNIIYCQTNLNRLTSVFNIGQTTVVKQHLMDLKLISQWTTCALEKFLIWE